jgi:CHAT domain
MVCRLPTHSDEFFQTRSASAHWRMFGHSGYTILLLEDEFFEKLKEHPGFVCVISNDATYARVAATFAERNEKRWLHVTTVETETSEPKLWNIDRAFLYEWTRSIVVAHMKRRGMPTPDDSGFRQFEPWDAVSVPIPSRGHNILTPTEVVLTSLGYTFDLPDDTLNGNDDDTFAEALVRMTEHLEATLRELTGDSDRPPGVPQVIITVPSVFRQLKPNGLRKEAPPEIRRTIRAVLRQAQYIALRATPEEMKEMMGSQLANAVLGMRTQELFLYTAALTVSACSLCCPVLRLPPQLDRVRTLLVGLATLSRKGNEVQRRRNQLALRIGETFKSLIPARLYMKLETYSNQGVKLIGDVPLELVPIHGLPLSLRCSVSRLPTLPGNLLVRHSLMRPTTFLHPSDFHDVLVVRSFAPNDPIRNLLEVSVQVVLRRGTKMKVRFVDVSNEEEFVEAFNGFDGKIAIFDGHGAQSAEVPQGTLAVGDLKIDPFEFYKRINLPPIILLSACETHTLEGFETSAASAFLFMGARSVLGTLAPIDARSAAMLIARFLYRLEAFLPVLKNPMNWTEVVTGMLRMSYVTDIVFKFEQLHSLPVGSLRNVQMTANVAINSGDAGWFELMLEGLSKATHESVERVRERWMDTCYFSETLRYVHLGSPEHLFVVPE